MITKNVLNFFLKINVKSKSKIYGNQENKKVVTKNCNQSCVTFIEERKKMFDSLAPDWEGILEKLTSLRMKWNFKYVRKIAKREEGGG